MKYVLVSGGVISGIGKGILASSCGLLLKTVGMKICVPKLANISSQNADSNSTYLPRRLTRISMLMPA